jgi:hypothetical protein
LYSSPRRVALTGKGSPTASRFSISALYGPF